MLSDARYGLRQLLKSPTFTLVVIFALAVGIGANITIFGFANALLLHPLDVFEPDRLIRAYSKPDNPVEMVGYDDYEQYRDRNQSLASLAMFHWGGLRPVRLREGLEMVHVMPVTGNYFETLGLGAVIGRTIRPDDDKPGVGDVAVLSDACWRGHFDSDPSIVGRVIVINRIPVTVVGVLPAAFKGTIGTPVVPQIYVPWRGLPCQWNCGGGHLIGRLKPGQSRDAAQADLSRIAAQLTTEHKRQTTISVSPARTLAPVFIGAASWFAILFMIVVGVVLLIACDNVAILLLARAVTRRREMGIRLALGASRSRLLRQLLTEALMLSGIGTAGAMALAYVSARWLTQIYLPVPMPIALSFDFDWRVVGFAVVLSLVTTLLFGLGPGVQAAKQDVISILKEGGANSSTGDVHIRSSLVAVQVALSTVLLAVAAISVHSLVAPGRKTSSLDPNHILIATLNLPRPDYSAEKGTAFYERLLESFEHAAGVTSATLMDNIPLANSKPLPYEDMRREGNETLAGGGAQRVYRFATSPGSFRTFSIALLEGRDFTSRDDASAAAVGIINQTLAHRFWPGESAIGKRLRSESGNWIEVIGLAQDSTYEARDEGPKAVLYRPAAQQYSPTMTLFLKTTGAPGAAASLVRSRVADLDPNLLAYNIIPLSDRLDLGFLPNRAAAIVAGILGIGALLLGTIGTYGVICFVVQQRRREIGIRIALGAQSGQVAKLIAGQGFKWTAVGLACGLPAAIGVSVVLRRFLFGVAAADPEALLGVAALLALSAVIACYAPARRASRMDPMMALREE